MFAAASSIARTVLYEGYLLYPYRASALKNRSRWHLGAVVPAARAAMGHGERAEVALHALAVPKGDDVLHVELRLLHLQSRAVQERRRRPGSEDDGWVTVPMAEGPQGVLRTWDEAVEVDVPLELPVAEIRGTGAHAVRCIEGGREVQDVTERLRIVRQRWPLEVRVEVSSRPVADAAQVVTVRVLNQTTWDPSAPDPVIDPGRTEPRLRQRDDALRRSLLSAHVLVGLRDGTMRSSIDPPAWAADVVAALPHEGLWASLIGAGGTGGADAVVLGAPIIVGDHPQVAPESPHDLFDGTEIDELLTLRTLTLTEAEKDEARGTDPRAAAIVDHVDGLSPDDVQELHGTRRPVGQAGEPPAGPAVADTPWWDPGADASVSPHTDRHPVDGVLVGRGDRVVLRPRRRADAQDMFLDGLVARVEAVLFDVDGGVTFAVTLDDDPGADLMAEMGRFRYFGVDEVRHLAHSPSQAGGTGVSGEAAR